MSNTKEKVLNWQREIESAKRNEFKAVLDRKEAIATAVSSLFQRIQKQDYKDPEEFNQLGARIDELNQESKVLLADYHKQMKKRFKDCHEAYPSIYDMLINGTVDPQTLRSVLDTYDQVERGFISTNEGMSRGLDYMTNKYKLPDDFFNRDAIGKPRRR